MILSPHFLSLSTSLYLSILVHALSIHTHSSPTIYLHLSISAHSIIITSPIHSLSLSISLRALHNLYILSIYLSALFTSSPTHYHYLIILTLSLPLCTYTLSLYTLCIYLSILHLHSPHTHSISAHSTPLPFYFSTHSHYIYLHTLYTLSTLYLSISIYSLYLHSIYLPSPPTYIILILLLYDLYITLCVLRRYSLFCRELEGVMIIVDRLRNS